MKTSLLVINLVIILSTYEAAKLPPNIPRCKFDDTPCFEDAVKQAITIMKSGNQKINLLSLDPLHVNEINIDTGAGNFRLILNFRDADITGFSAAENIQIENKSTDRIHWVLNTFLPKIEVYGNYKADGRILILPIQGEGKATITIDDVKASLTIKEQKERIDDKNGKAHMKLEKFEVKFTPTRVRMNLENLFNGDKTLGDNLNTFINENWQEVFKEIQPAIEESLGAIFLELTNRVYQKVPYENIYL